VYCLKLKGSITTVGFSDEKPSMDIDTSEEYESLIKQEDKNE